MTFDVLEEQKHIVDLSKENWSMNQDLSSFKNKYILDYLRNEATFLKIGRQYYKNPELTLEEVYKRFEEDRQESCDFYAKMSLLSF